MTQGNIGFIIEGLLKELASGVPSQTVLLEIQQNETLKKIFDGRPQYQIIDNLSEEDLKSLLSGFLIDIKAEITPTQTEQELSQKVATVDIVKQAKQAKAASLGNQTLGNIKESRREWISKLVNNYALVKRLDDLPLSASSSDVEKLLSDQDPQLTREIVQKQQEAAEAATAIASAIATHKGPRPDDFATILQKKIEVQNPKNAAEYKTIVEEATPLALALEAATSAGDKTSYKPYFQTFIPGNVGSKPLDEKFKGTPKEHAEVAGAIVSSSAERILKNPELRKKLAPDEIALLKRIGERGFTPKKITATKWLAQLFTTPPSDIEFKKVNDSIFSMFELKRLGLLPTSAFSDKPKPAGPGATIVEKYTIWDPRILFYATIVQTAPQELVFSPVGNANQWLVGWAAQTGVGAGAEFLVGTGARAAGQGAVARAGGTLLAGALTGGWGFVAGLVGSDILTRAAGGIKARAKAWFGISGKTDAWGMEGALLPLVLVLAPFFILLMSLTIFGPVLTAFGITSPYTGTSGTGNAAASASYGGLASLGSFNQFNVTNVGGIVTGRGATRPLNANEQAKISSAVNAFSSFALFSTPLGQTKINLTAFPSGSPDEVIGLSPPGQAGNIALYENAFSFSDQSLARLLAHELTHQIEWFYPNTYHAFLSGTTTVPRGYCGPLGTYIKSLPETSEETFAEAAAMYIINDPRIKQYCGGATYAFVHTMFTKGVSL